MKNKILSVISLVLFFSLCLVVKPQPVFALSIILPPIPPILIRCLLILFFTFILFLIALIVSLIILFLKRNNENDKPKIIKRIKINIIILVMIFLLGLFTENYFEDIMKIFVSKDSKNIQVTPTPVSSFSPLQNSEKTTISFGLSRLEIPRNFSIGRLQVFSDDGKEYLIESAGNSPGPCPWEDDGTGCAGYDEKLDGYSILRIWKNKYGIVAINPHGGAQSDSYVIYKSDPTQKEKYTYLSDQEVQMWKDIITGKNRQ